MPPNNERADSGFRAFWTSLPGVLTGAAAFIGAIAAVAALFIGGDDDEQPTPAVTSTVTAAPPVDDLDRLLAMLPASMRDDCEEESAYSAETLARVKCDRWGATFYYDLFKDPLEARSSFAVSVDLAEEDAPGQAGHAEACREASRRKPFVGTWGKPGQPRASGQLLCTFEPDPVVASDGIASWEWTVVGRPILASLLYSGDRKSAAEGAYLAWRRGTR
jgi:hypothetical protein